MLVSCLKLQVDFLLGSESLGGGDIEVDSDRFVLIDASNIPGVSSTYTYYFS